MAAAGESFCGRRFLSVFTAEGIRLRAELYRPRFCAHLGFYTKTCQKELVYETGRSNLKNEKRARRDAERKNGEKAAIRINAPINGFYNYKKNDKNLSFP